MRKIDELRQELSAKKQEIRTLLDADKVEEAKSLGEEIRKLEDKITLEEMLDKEERKEVESKMEKREVKDEQVEIRSAFYKAIAGKPMTAEERDLVSGATGAQGGYLIPKDIQTSINELKRQYKSAKALVNVVNVSTESGSFVVEADGNITGLVNFDDNNTGLAEYTPKFRSIEWKVKNYGIITPVAKSFLQDETANFMAYLNRLFARKAVRTENEKIFEALKEGKTATELTDINDIKTLINVELDPALKGISVIVTNQDGFNVLDQMEDKNGRPLLQPNPADSTQLLLLGLPVHVFSNAELATVDGKAPIFAGALEEGVRFFDRNVYEVATSEHAGFSQNMIKARVVERFDVKQTDSQAYVYAEINTETVEG